MDIRERYEREPDIRTLVDAMHGMLMKSEITPRDLARCAVLAAERHAMLCHQPVMIVLADHPDIARRYGVKPSPTTEGAE